MPLHFGQIMRDQLLDDGSFGGEIAVEITNTHPRRAGEVLHRRPVKAFFGKGDAHQSQNVKGALFSPKVLGGGDRGHGGSGMGAKGK